MMQAGITLDQSIAHVRENRQKSDKERIEQLELAVAQLKHRLHLLENKGHSE